MRVGGFLVRNINTRRRDVVDDVQHAFEIVALQPERRRKARMRSRRLDIDPSTPEPEQ